MWSAYTLQNGAAPAGGFSLSAAHAVQRANCNPPTQSQRRMSRAVQASRRTVLAVSGEAQHEAFCARAALRRYVISACTMETHRTGNMPVCFGAQLRCDMSIEAFNAKPALRVLRGAVAPALAVSGEKGSQHSSMLRARIVQRCLWLPIVGKGHRTGERLLSFGARPWCDVHLQPPTPSQRRVSSAAQAHRRCSWFWGWMRSTQAFCTREPRRAG